MTTKTLGRLLLATLLLSSPGHAQTLVRDLDNPARQPFQAELRSLTITTSGGVENFQVALVPPGKRLVIEHVSLRISSLEATSGGAPQPRFRTFATLVMKTETVAAQHELVVNRADVGTASFNVASQPLRAYVDPGSAVFVQIDCIADDGGDSLLRVTHVTVSGHLVDLS
jgi:hypothetical protein